MKTSDERSARRRSRRSLVCSYRVHEGSTPGKWDLSLCTNGAEGETHIRTYTSEMAARVVAGYLTAWEACGHPKER